MEGLTIQPSGDYTVVTFSDASLMDPMELDTMGKQLYRLVDEEDRRHLVLDFGRVQYISSQFIGILLSLHHRLTKLPKSELVLCNVGPRLMELLKITRLEKVLTIRSTANGAVPH